MAGHDADEPDFVSVRSRRILPPRVEVVGQCSTSVRLPVPGPVHRRRRREPCGGRFVENSRVVSPPVGDRAVGHGGSRRGPRRVRYSQESFFALNAASIRRGRLINGKISAQLAGEQPQLPQKHIFSPLSQELCHVETIAEAVVAAVLPFCAAAASPATRRRLLCRSAGSQIPASSRVVAFGHAETSRIRTGRNVSAGEWRLISAKWRSSRQRADPHELDRDARRFVPQSRSTPFAQGVRRRYLRRFVPSPTTPRSTAAGNAVAEWPPGTAGQ